MQKTLIAAILASATAMAWAAPESYTIDSTHTYPSFAVNHLGFSTARGVFEKTSGKVVIDRAAKTGSIDITIDTASLTTNLAKRDEHLKSPDFFNVAQFPTMTFKSDKLKFKGDKLVGVDGQLTLLGVTKPVSLKVNNSTFGEHPMMKKAWAGADASAVIKRSEFGMNTYVPAVGDEVNITLQIEAMKD